MKRRALLTALGSGLVAAAGCTAPVLTGHSGSLAVELPTARLEMEPLAEVDVTDRLLYDLPEAKAERHELLTEAVDGGTEVRDTEPPLPANRNLSHADGVYRLDHAVVEETPATTFSVLVDVLESDVPDAETVRFSELPAVDRERFARVGLADGDPVGVGTTFRYPDAKLDESVLVPDSAFEAIRWENGAEAEWSVEDSYDRTLKTYAYEGEQVATANAYRERVRERFAFEFTELPDAQRAVVETAVDEGRYVVGPDESEPPAVGALAERFADRREVRPLGRPEDGDDGEANGSYLVTYEGTTYWTTFFRAAERTAESETAGPDTRTTTR